MIDLDHCIRLGTLSKIHGVKGQLVLRLEYSGFEHITNMELVFVEIDQLPVPFFIEEYRNISDKEILLSLEDIHGGEKAQKLVGNHVWIAPDRIPDRNAPSPNPTHSDLTGYRVMDNTAGYLGTLHQILDFEHNPLLQIIRDKQEILIPFQNEFILDIDDQQKTILVKIPDGLIDINRQPSPPHDHF